ncbi:TIGR03745 family integrating conjugative element membrane protein [Uliginosibacterium gangwonense]|uniref:TIGR03745 family integrating conjugative element membrane protein n=1 Tax=Uliginosibacterium gangwonense TaxID=392736 RepID=UPI00036190C6|nr:TIGR03745 family integrating conjugative element membrane protein [Uliginosibacterium gangwonense]
MIRKLFAHGHKVIQRGHARWMLALFLLVIRMDKALAGMPTAPKVDGSIEDGDFIGYLKAYWKNAVAILVLCLCSYALIEVGSAALQSYHDYRKGKAELSNLIMQLVVGFVILMIMVYLFTQATGVFS